MNVGIIIHSNTGNTLSVGEKLKENLLAQGHKVQLERVTAVNENPNSKEPVKLATAPDIAKYDYVIFAAPVHAFSLSQVMAIYLKQLPDLKGLKSACFVTQQLSKPWLGGNHAIKQMVRVLTDKGGKITETGVVNWSGKTREEQVRDIQMRFCK